MKRMLLAGFCAALLCLLASGCQKDTAPVSSPVLPIVKSPLAGSALVGDIPVAFPLVSKPAGLTILATGYNGYDQENVFVWQQYEKMTGVDVNWLTVTRSTRAEAVHTALSNRQSIDLILRCKLSANKLIQYGESGLILDLAKDGLLEKNAPNCWAYLQAHPDTLASVMNPDGSLYALPQVNSGAELRVGLKLFVNKRWLEAVNLPLPKTTAEFRRLLTAFKELDANANGDPSDEIPFGCADWSSARQALFGAFGLGSRGMHNLTVDADPTTGKARLIAGADSYRDYLTYMHTLYAEGLLDPYIFTITDDQWMHSIANDRIGVFASTNLAWVPADKLDNWVAIEEALEGPNGEKLWAPIRANFHSTGAALIPAACRDPALVLRWLDYFWTDEGTLFYHMGIEGETFAAKPDGRFDYLPRIYEEMRTGNLPFDDVVATYSPYPGGSNPTVEIAPYFMGGEMAPVPAQAARKLFAYAPAEFWPSFTFTSAESETLVRLQSDISKFTGTMQIEFITGARPLSEWDAYKESLGQLGVDEFVAVYQAAADRYHALGAKAG